MNFTNIYYLQLAVQRRDSAPRRRGSSVQTETAAVCPGDAAPESRCLEGNAEMEGRGGGAEGGGGQWWKRGGAGGETQIGRQRGRRDRTASTKMLCDDVNRGL